VVAQAAFEIVSHTPIECEKLLAAQTYGEWFDVARMRIPFSEKVYTWWSYRAADWTVGDRGRRLDHIWVSRALKDAVSDFRILRDARGWDRPLRPRARDGDGGDVNLVPESGGGGSRFPGSR